jgi:hypothetical protein
MPGGAQGFVGFPGGGQGGQGGQGSQGGQTGQGGQLGGNGQFPGGGQGNQGGQGGQGNQGGIGQLPGGTTPQGTTNQQAPGGLGGLGGSGGGMNNLLDASTPGAQVQALLKQDASGYRWVAAAIGAQNAAGYQLATGDPVMAIGGFNGSDPSPTLAQFQAYVAQHKIHYYVGGGIGMRANGGADEGSTIGTWVQAHFKAQTVDNVTIYDLTSPTS